MPPEIVALIDKPWLLAIILGLGAACGIIVGRTAERISRAERRSKWQKRRDWQRNAEIMPLKISAGRAAPDPADQLCTVMAANFRSRPLLNKPERRLLAHLDKALEDEAPGWRAMGQVSLGEILASEDKDAYFAINSKRVDLLIVDANCRPLHVVEFQGTGHHQGTAAARDAVKKEALRKAGIGYVEIVSGDTPAELRAMI